MDFIAIDFEIANPKHASVCAAGWATVRGGQVVDSGSWLCRPPAGHDEFGLYNVRVHGITADRVASQPTFAERVPDLLGRLGVGLPILAHNASFDMSVLRQSLATCGLPRPPAAHYCTMKWSKSLLQLPKYRLPTVCEHLGIEIENHHDAGSDALSAARVALRLAERLGVPTVEELDGAANRMSRRR